MEGAFLGHIDFVLQRPRTATAVIKSRCKLPLHLRKIDVELGIIAFLEWADFKELTKKYKQEADCIFKSASNHSDRIAASFGHHTINRTYFYFHLMVFNF